MVKIRESGEYVEMLEDLLSEDPALESVIRERTKWFRKNPKDTRLDNHPLTKVMEGKWAFSITDDLRIVYKWLSKTTVRFLVIGAHGRVYKRK